LFRIFEREGGVANYVRDRRLLRVHALLAAPDQRRYLSRIAEDHGFTSATHFSRAFRAKFGYAPRKVQGPVRAAVTARAVAVKPDAAAFERWAQLDRAS
jgi:AraC-like DNA-binding protein